MDCPLFGVTTVVYSGEKRGTLKICEIESNKGIFPYLYDSLILKISTKCLQKVRNHVLILAFQTKVVKYELSLVVLEDKFLIIGPKVSSFIQNGPRIALYVNKCRFYSRNPIMMSKCCTIFVFHFIPCTSL